MHKFNVNSCVFLFLNKRCTIIIKIKCKKVQSFKYEINPCKPVFNSALILELRTCDQTVN